MTKIDPLQAFADNLRWTKNYTELDTQAKIGKAAGVDQRTAGRWMSQSNAPTLENIVGLALALKIEAWQLLAPGFGKGLFLIDEERQIAPVRQPATRKQPAAAA